MLKDITLGQYYPGESILHKSDPRTKIILVIAYMVVIFLVDTFTGYIISILFTLLSAVVSDIPLKYVFRGLKPIIFIALFVMVLNILTIKGTPLLEYGIIHISYEGVETAVKMIIRLMLLVLAASLLTLTTTPILLTDGIEKLMAPLRIIKVPVHEIAMMMTIALRFIPTLLEETEKIMKAQASRGADFDTGNLVQRAKSFVPVLIPLFLSAFRRADELASAMESRCYRGGEGRTRMKQLKLGRYDVVISLAMVMYISIIIILEFF